MVSIVIQSGGQSSRMGEEKGLVSFCDKPLIQNVLERVAHLGDEVIIVTNKPELYKFLGIKTVTDIYENYGALAGLHSGLSHATYDLVINLACDIPYVDPSLVAFLVDELKQNPQADVVIPKTELGFEPMQAVYRKSRCLPAVELMINKGKRRMISWFDLVTVQEINEPKLRSFDKDLKTFLNLNSKHDLQLAEDQFGCLNRDSYDTNRSG